MNFTKNLYTIPIQKFSVSGTDKDEIRELKREIFTNNCYYFETDLPKPNILDIGAHIGLSSIYFHHLYPNAHIVAVEPHPQIFEILQKNLIDNFIDNVTTVKAAVVESTNTSDSVNLYSDPEEIWLSNSSLKPGSWTGHERTNPIKVPAINFSELITNQLKNPNDHWDLVKMDIEGFEKELLLSTKNELQKVERLIVEAHNWDRNQLLRITKHLTHYGLKLDNTNQLKRHKKLVLYEFVR